jgi:hypothetical protein
MRNAQNSNPLTYINSSIYPFSAFLASRSWHIFKSLLYHPSFQAVASPTSPSLLLCSLISSKKPVLSFQDEAL